MDKRILVVYIATKGYNNYFDGFINTLVHNFCPDINKEVVRFNDIGDLRDYYAGRGTYVHNIQLRHYPWPIITLMKFQYIKEAIDKLGKYCTHVVYFNANIEFKNEITFEEYFDETKVTAVNHWAWTKSGFNFVTLGNNDYRSQAWIDEPYRYVQACQVAGPIGCISSMCDTVNKWIQLDLTKNIIPRWHDESYYNKYIHMLEGLNQVKFLDEHYNGDEVDEFSQKTFNPIIVMRAKDKLEELKDFNTVKGS